MDTAVSGEAWHVCILIPARNEEALLPRCLESVRAAQSRLRKSATSHIVVVADRSTDRTTAIATTLLRGRGTVATTDAGAVGVARRTAASIALARYRGPVDRCWLAHTDADTIVPPTWLLDQLHFAQSGFEAVAGTVSVDSFEGHDPLVADRFRATYHINADGTHQHVHGANLGVRADAYVRAGGWAPLSSAEDHDLWRRLGTTSASRYSTSTIEVVTSGRRIGRAPAGFAEALAAHNPGRG